MQEVRTRACRAPGFILSWLRSHLHASPSPPRRRTVALLAGLIFLLAFGVRMLHWQDLRAQSDTGEALHVDLVKLYEREAERMAADGGLLFPNQPPAPGDARMLVHPPGYALLIRALTSEGADRGHRALRIFQALADALSAVMVFLIGMRLLPLAAAVTGGLLAALSPHLAYYALWQTPESLAAPPVLLAVYLLARTWERPRWIEIALAGALIGVSCWLRSNALLLAPFMSGLLLVGFRRRGGWRYALTLTGAALLVIAPITARNLLVYGRFIPLSLGAGITLIEGIADYDSENRFDLPATDRQVALKDAEWHGRPDYAGNLWTPDGIERDRERFRRGLRAIRERPFWFAGVMLRRAGFMLRYNDSGPTEWPLNTSQVAPVGAEPPYSHTQSEVEPLTPAWSGCGDQLMMGDAIIAPQARVSIDGEGRLLVLGDREPFGDQLISAPIAVLRHTDYLLRLPARVEQGRMAVRVVSLDRRITLASAILAADEEREGKRRREEGDMADEYVRLTFATGGRDAVRLVFSNDTGEPLDTAMRAGCVELIEAGGTRGAWTAVPRAVIRAAQKNLYRTGFLLPAWLAGAILVALGGRWRALALLLVVPAYYLLLQSALHTEYRYILVIHYFFFGLAGFAFYTAARFAYALLRRRRREI